MFNIDVYRTVFDSKIILDIRDASKLLIYNQKHKIKKIEIKLNTLTYNNRHNIFNWK